MKRDYIVKPVYKALKVLESLGEEQRDLTLSEVCARTRLPKTTAFRYLCTLCELGFVQHDPETDLYGVGLRVWELGQLAWSRQSLREIALPYMLQLRARFNETVNLGVMHNRAVVYIEMVESRHALRMQARLGSRDPLYSTALGKAILAFLPVEQWEEHLPPQLIAFTPHTITSKAQLYDDLRATYERGYSLDHGENEEGSVCVGVPLRDAKRRVLAALSISAPATRLDTALEQSMGEALRAVAAEISQQLGVHAQDG